MKSAESLKRTKLTRRAALKAAAAGSLYMVVSACTPSVSSAPSASASASTAVKTPTVKPDFTIIDGSAPTSFDQSKSGDLGIINNLSDTLTRIDRNRAPEVGPWLAASWTAVTPTRWRLKLQKATFQSGKPFDADAAKWNIEWYRKNGTNATAQAAIDHAEVVDPSTVDVVLSFPTGILPLVWSATGAMMDPAWAQSSDFSGDKLVGTGPGVLYEWVKGDHITLEANPNYWAGDLSFRRVTYRAISNAATRANAAIAGEGDIVSNILPQDVDRVKASGKARIVTVESLRTQNLRIRDDVRPFDNKLVRQAVNYGVNIPEIVKNVFLGYGKPTQGQAQTAQAKYWQKDVPGYGYDPEKAKSLLAQAGFPSGFSTQIGTARGFDQGDYELCQAISGQLDKIGVKAEVVVHEAADYTQGVLGQKAVEPLFYWGIGNFIPDPENTFRDLSRDRAAGPYVHDAKLTDIYNRMQRAVTDDERNRIAFEGISWIRDYAPLLFGNQVVQIYALANRIDWTPRAYSFSQYLSEITVKS